ncbi:hypothetical protein CDD83_8926 [Cordyceps sp. RAO-2017]|nr:hypothetical protein CDD83_8926 [Cordyceps sp. RAO-2017]
MRPDFAFVLFSLLGTAAAAAIDGLQTADTINAEEWHVNDLFKRRGGGGSGGRGGGSSGGGGSGGRGGGGNSGGGGSSGGRPSGSRGNTGSGSNLGGTSRGGTGPTPRFGGGRFYGGGATRPYRAGAASPAGIAPFLLVGAALAFWPGVWLHGAHAYPYSYVHRFHNATTDKNETAKVLCACAEFAECGCDENNSTAYYNDLIGNGSYEALNKSVVNVGDVRGEKTLLINGTLPNGTTADGPDSSAFGSGLTSLVEAAGYWPVVATVAAAVFLI